MHQAEIVSGGVLRPNTLFPNDTPNIVLLRNPMLIYLFLSLSPVYRSASCKVSIVSFSVLFFGKPGDIYLPLPQGLAAAFKSSAFTSQIHTMGLYPVLSPQV